MKIIHIIHFRVFPEMINQSVAQLLRRNMRPYFRISSHLTRTSLSVSQPGLWQSMSNAFFGMALKQMETPEFLLPVGQLPPLMPMGIELPAGIFPLRPTLQNSEAKELRRRIYLLFPAAIVLLREYLHRSSFARKKKLTAILLYIIK